MTAEEFAARLDQVELIRECNKCNGEGYTKEADRWLNCPHCDNGRVVTEFGEKIVELLRGRLSVSARL